MREDRRASPSSTRGSERRKQVTCATKANIMKLTEGTLKRVFEQVAPGVRRHQIYATMIVDNCLHAAGDAAGAVRRDS